MKNKSLILLILVTILLTPFKAMAISLTDSIEIHGFINQGYVYSPDNPYAGTAAMDGSFDFREAAINGFWEVNDRFRIAGQVLARQIDQANDGSPKVDFILADYLAYSTNDSTFGVRIGRIKNEIGFYNATRDIPNSHPGINVPSSVYFDSFRDALIATDGINFYGSLNTDLGLFELDLYAGISPLDGETTEYYIFREPVSGNFDEASLQGFRLTFKPNIQHDLSFAFSAFQAHLKLKDTQSTSTATSNLQNSAAVQQAATLAATPVGLGGLGLIPGSSEFNTFVAQAAEAEAAENYNDYITGADIDAIFAMLSVQYAVQNWVLTAEYLNVFTSLNQQILGEDNKRDVVSEGYYLQAEWFATSNISAMLRYEELVLNTGDREGKEIAQNFPNDPYRGYSKGITFAMRWLITPSWSITGQYSKNEGTATTPVYDGMHEDTFREHWDLYIMQLTYQF